MPDTSPKAQGARRAAFASRFLYHASGLRVGLWELGIGIFFLLLYTFTLAPGLLPADAGEYQAVGALLGVAHPPGFALYTLLSWLISRLPRVTPATAINFLSALTASLTLICLSRAVQRLTGSPWAGACATLALGCSTTFWAQATTANVRMLSAFAVAFALDRILIYRHLPNRRTLAWVAFALGLGVSHHGSLIFIAAVLGLYTLWLDPSILRRPWPLAAGLLPFLAWLYFPLRPGAFGAPSRIATLDGFLEHVLARGFSGDILYFAHLKDLPDRLSVFGNILTFEFVWPLLLLAALGGAASLWRDRRFGLALLAAFAAHSFVAVTYRAPQTVEYLLPAYVLMAILGGCTFAELFRMPLFFAAKSAEDTGEQRLSSASFLAAHFAPLPSTPRLLYTFISTLIPLITAGALIPQFSATFPSYRLLAGDTSTRDYAGSVLAAAPPNALVLASWHWATPLWYLQRVEGQRPDVEVKYVFPRGPSLAQNWADEITAALPARRVVVTSLYAQEYAALPFRFVPLGPAWEVRSEPLMAPPAGLIAPQNFGDWAFLGYRIESSSGSSVADRPVAITAAWRTSGAPQDINFYVHLLGPDGRLYGQMDVSYPAFRYISGEVLLDRYRIMPDYGTPAGDYDLVAGAYLSNGTRLAEAHLTTVPLSNFRPSAVSPRPGEVPLGGSILFTGFDLSPPGSLRPGQSLTINLHFLAVRPIVEDDAVKMDLRGAGWRVVSEGTPAGGAIPTLKWIADSRITDRRTLPIPSDAAPGPAQLSLVLYDSFTQRPLPILDPRLAALGPTLSLGTIEIVSP